MQGTRIFARMEGTKCCQQEEKLHQFLLGLDDSAYSTIISQIVTMDLLPSVNNAYLIVIREERHRIVAKGRDEKTEAVAFAARINEKQSLLCSVC